MAIPHAPPPMYPTANGTVPSLVSPRKRPLRTTINKNMAGYSMQMWYNCIRKLRAPQQYSCGNQLSNSLYRPRPGPGPPTIVVKSTFLRFEFHLIYGKRRIKEGGGWSLEGDFPSLFQEFEQKEWKRWKKRGESGEQIPGIFITCGRWLPPILNTLMSLFV